MSERKSTKYELDKALGRIVKPSIFDKLIKEVDATEIPAKYVEQVIVYYYDGNIIELKGSDITNPIPINKSPANWDVNEEAFKKMRDIKVYLNTTLLEKDINMMVEDYLGKFC